jgi:hypothetical protein
MISRTWTFSLTLLGQLALGCAMGGEIQDIGPLAPASPDGEEIAYDAEFSAACMTEVNRLAAGLKWEMSSPLVTRSNDFGLVMRLDAKSSGDPDISPFITRVVCWKIPGTDKFNIQIAVVDIPPLRSQPSK